MHYLILGQGATGAQDPQLHKLLETAPELPYTGLYKLGFSRQQVSEWLCVNWRWSARVGPLPEDFEEVLLRDHCVLYYLTAGPTVAELRAEQERLEGTSYGRAAEIADAYAHQALLAACDWHFEKARAMALSAAGYDRRYEVYAQKVQYMARKSL